MRVSSLLFAVLASLSAAAPIDSANAALSLESADALFERATAVAAKTDNNDRSLVKRTTGFLFSADGYITANPTNLSRVKVTCPVPRKDVILYFEYQVTCPA